jgi:rSAM/selenodomain-associated transferase 1
MSETTALAIMARYPEAGKTKTRLARSLGNDAVLHLYRAFLTDLAQRFGGAPDYTVHWVYTPAEVAYAEFIETLAPAAARSMRYVPQQGKDLNERLHNAFRWMASHDIKRTVLIGSDSPHVSREIIDQASAALETADVVLGPAEDGGYYLIAMRSPHDVFSGIPMSTPEVGELTVALAEQQGLRVHLLEPLLDVDELPDLQLLAALLEKNPSLAPATANAIAALSRTAFLALE